MTAIDSTAWSVFVRRSQNARLSPREQAVRAEVRRLVVADEAPLIGAIRQELLSGISDLSQFERLRRQLRDQRHEQCVMDDYELAAQFANVCRKHGVQASPTDVLLAAVSHRLSADILTTDPDFERMVGVLPIRLHPLSRISA